MRYSRKRKVTIIFCLLGFIFVLGIGFAAFSNTLNISGSANVKPNSDNFALAFASSKDGNDYLYEDIVPTTNPDDLVANTAEIDSEYHQIINNIGGTFTEDGQSITYDLLVANVGSYDAYLTNFVVSDKECTIPEGSDASEELVYAACEDINIKVLYGDEGDSLELFETTDLSNNILAKGEYKNAQIIIDYPEGSALPDGLMEVNFGEIELFYVSQDNPDLYKQIERERLKAKGENILMRNIFNKEYEHDFTYEYKLFRFENINNLQVESVKVVTNQNIPNDAIESCDASSDEDGSVLAWYTDKDDNGLYELYLGADGLVFIDDASRLFSSYINASSFDLEYLDTSKAISFKGMFSGCKSVKNLDLSTFETNNVDNISFMFDYCTSLESAELSSFDTSKVVNMEALFQACISLKEVDLSSFDTSNVTDMGWMFYYCESLTDLNLNNFDTSKVDNMSAMFSWCPVLTNLDLSSFNTSNVVNMSYMFSGCSKLSDFSVTGFDTANVTNMSFMFDGCSSIVSLDLSSFDTGKVENMKQMLARCTKLSNLYIGNFNTSNVVNMRNMFAGSTSLTSLDLSHFSTASLEDAYGLFNGCTSLKSVNLDNFVGDKLIDFSYAFFNCYLLREVSMPDFTGDSLTIINHVFARADALKNVELPKLNLSKVTTYKNMFFNVSGSVSITLLNIPENVSFMASKFPGYTNITWV